MHDDETTKLPAADDDGAATEAADEAATPVAPAAAPAPSAQPAAAASRWAGVPGGELAFVAVLLLIALAAGFALGRATADSDDGRVERVGMRGGPAMGGAPGGGPGMRGAPGSMGGGMRERAGMHRGVGGTVTGVDGDTITFDQVDGVESTIEVDDDTEIVVRGEEDSIEVSDIEEGDRVLVLGSPDDDSAKRILVIRADDLPDDGWKLNQE